MADELWRVVERTSPDSLRGIADRFDFFDFFEEPVVMPVIVGLAGLDPCRRGHGRPVDEIAVDGGNIGEE